MKCARENCNREFVPHAYAPQTGPKIQKYCSFKCRRSSLQDDYLKRHVDKLVLLRKKFYERNRDRMLLKAKTYYECNRDNRLKYNKNYRTGVGLQKVKALKRIHILRKRRQKHAFKQAQQLNQLIMENSMAIVQTEKSVAQNEALGEFLADWGGLKEFTLKVAKSYKKCIDLDMDMSQYVKDRRLHEKLLLIASDKLLPMSQAELLFLPMPMASILSTLPAREQERVMKNGVDVMRDGKVVRVPFVNLSGVEVKAVIDTTGGMGRIVDPKEQAQRAKARNAPKAHDELVTLRFNYSQIVELRAIAHKAGKPVERVIMDLLSEQGII